MKNSNEPTEDEIIALNDAMEQESWERLNEDLTGLDADSYNDNMGYACDDEYYEPDFEDDEQAMTSAGMGEDESYGYIEDMGFYEYED